MEDIAVVAVPFTAQGHVNQLLHLSLRLAARGLSVHYATSATHNRQAQLRLQGWPANALANIRFHDLQAPAFPAPPPDRNPTTKFPTHLIPAFYASLDLRAPLGPLLRSLAATCRRLVVIHDVLMPFASHEAATIANAESFQLQCAPTSEELFYLWPLMSSSRSPPSLEPSQEVLDVIVPVFSSTLDDGLKEYAERLDFNINAIGTLFNTFRAIDGDFFDLLAQSPRHQGKKLFAVGPLNPLEVAGNGTSHHEYCLNWLDEQPPGSVVYASFGSTSTLGDEQINQLAIGLKNSGQRFIWVLRDADRGDIFAADGESEKARERELPPGFLEETRGVGAVVRGWAPQLEILAHPSTGAFMSHCGWNSCMESLSMGVPIIAWPMHSDQPRNAAMVTGYLKAGIAVRGWARHMETVMAEEIEEVIKRMMVSDEGKEVKQRAKLIGEEARLAVADGGSSAADLNSFVAHI